jgi:hypothetical protein
VRIELDLARLADVPTSWWLAGYIVATYLIGGRVVRRFKAANKFDVGSDDPPIYFITWFLSPAWPAIMAVWAGLYFLSAGFVTPPWRRSLWASGS